ncbi:DUF4266 domain-containing protein [Sulfurimonas sp. SAG-AH-194-I05]|nr:DUF4266 domain-containing protein [Sulfurimonas sp. SAG-AH-194-I05]MDF1875950.1 DUF4266 domain-containing protein [Sulfurimonas sp. SAG-AH-194-I05]
MKFTITIIVLILFSGCTKEIKPWEKGMLAKDSMKSSSKNTIGKKFEEHMFFSKEASKGGSGISGGGCGCN